MLTRPSVCSSVPQEPELISLPPPRIHLTGSQIEQVSSFKLLGVVVNDTLTWSDHINHVVTIVSSCVNLLRCLHRFLSCSLWVLYLRFTFCLWLTTVMYYGTSVPSTTRLVSNSFSTMSVDLPSIAFVSPPLPSERNFVFLHFAVSCGLLRS